jgi:hypothetical protein
MGVGVVVGVALFFGGEKPKGKLYYVISGSAYVYVKRRDKKLPAREISLALLMFAFMLAESLVSHFLSGNRPILKTLNLLICNVNWLSRGAIFSLKQISPISLLMKPHSLIKPNTLELLDVFREASQFAFALPVLGSRVHLRCTGWSICSDFVLRHCRTWPASLWRFARSGLHAICGCRECVPLNELRRRWLGI